MRRPLAAVALWAALVPSSCAAPSVPMPDRSPTADFAIVNRTRIDGFAEVYVLVHVPTRQCFVSIDPGGEGGGGITATDAQVCATYTRVEGTR